MERIIKFRAWDKNLKKMISNPVCIEAGRFTDFIGLNDLPIKFDEQGFELMQYTGLKDKEGKEIYEGDIFNITEEPEEMNTVEYYEGIYFLSPHGIRLNVWYNHGEVIGNIHENPELLDK